MRGITATVTGSRLQRDAAVEHLLLDDLRDVLADPIDARARAWLLAILDGLLRVLPREFCCEEAGGYLEEVLEEYPSWDRQVQALRRQHMTLTARLRDVRDDFKYEPFGTVDRRTKRRLWDWIDQLEVHNRQETELLHTAVNLEVGVGD